MAEKRTIQYFKQHKQLGGNLEHQIYEVTVVNGRRVELLISTNNSYFLCNYYPSNTTVVPVLQEELQWLAVNHRGIFRLLAMYIDPNTSIYQAMVSLAAEHEIVL